MRLEFTVVEPAGNIANGVEALTRDLGRRILVSEAVRHFTAVHATTSAPSNPKALRQHGVSARMP